MRRLASAAIVTVTLGLAGCSPRRVAPEMPALLTNPTERSHAELASVVSGALNGAPVTIAESALTSDDVLIVEPARRRDAGGVQLDGRETRRPDHFRLVTSGGRCVLVHERTGHRWTLTSATCAPR
jgi:hypothetical protein